MYAYIKGKVVVKTNNYIVLENNGIGYKIFMSQNAIETLNEEEENVKIHTYYQVREDDISLYGFLSNDELRMFELLLSVSGIGAKSAITILSSISTSDFAMAVITDDTSKLVKIPGIGAKSAARIILELKDKLKNEDAMLKQNNTKAKKSVVDQEVVSEAIAALQILGYSKKEIDKALEEIELSNLTTEEIIKAGLKKLGK